MSVTAAVPIVSVILPTFNLVKYLCEAVASVRAQTFADWEILVADDGSDPETRAFLRGIDDERVVTLWLPHSGNPARVRNRAIRRARGVYLAFLDSDDVWVPRKLEIQLDLMRSRPGHRWSYTRDARIDEAGNLLSEVGIRPWVPHEGNIVEALLKVDALISTPSVMAERTLVDEAGQFDEEQRYAEDYDLWLRLAMRSDVSASSEALVRIRIHVDNFSRDRIAAYEGWVRLYGKMEEMVPDARLRSLCRRRRGESALTLAGLHVDRNDRRAVARTLVEASTYSWPYPGWWWGALKTAVRPIFRSSMQSMGKRSPR